MKKIMEGEGAGGEENHAKLLASTQSYKGARGAVLELLSSLFWEVRSHP